MKMRLVVLGLLVAGLAAAVAGAGALRTETAAAPAACPPGFIHGGEEEAALERAGHRGAESLVEQVAANSSCVAAKHPESLLELEIRQRELNAVRAAPNKFVSPGAYSAALEQRRKIVEGRTVEGTEGAWKPLGRGPLISNAPEYGSVNNLGLANLMGRIDSLEYDPVNRRLFASAGTGGLWMSTDLGETWTSIGETLPSQVVGAVAWSPANGGTVLAVSGDPTFGSNAYTGYGAFYSNDLGQTWTRAQGIPDGALGFEIEVDPTNPLEVYAATFFGLFRSTDGGRTYANVNLPTGACAGVAGSTTGRRECQLANVVTDVAIRPPGGVNGNEAAGTVLAVVGWRAGARKNADGTVQSPRNGLYRSASGAPNTFQQVGAEGFAPQERIGRTEFGITSGPAQDHDFLYAIVQDAVILNGGLDVIDAPEGVTDPLGAAGTVLNGIYVSADFGKTWTRMADRNQIAKNPATGTALVGSAGYEPGIQAWYNMWISPDPTRASLSGVPTRLAFGLEEVWQNELPTPQDGLSSFKVIGRYFSDEACLMRPLDLPECPHHRPPTTSMTTHPDQHEGLWIPDGSGGVTLAVGNDGGFYKNHAAAGQELDNGGWGLGNQNGFNTLLPYDVAMANDGTVYMGLQDNGHAKITPQGDQFMVYGGDGTFAEVNPENSDVAYEAYVFAAMRSSTDGGRSWRQMYPPVTNSRFINPFEMDPNDANHLVTGGNEIVETTFGPETTGLSSLFGSGVGQTCCGEKPWTKVFDLGTRARPGDEAATPSATDPANGMTAIDVVGDAIYAGYCGVCDILNTNGPFRSGIATNVGGADGPERMTTKGWHIASANGLPERFITSIAIDPNDARTIYVTLGGYSRRWAPPNTLHDVADPGEGHLFKSTDAGETFVDISGNLPDVPATWVTIRGQQLIVGTDIGVFANHLTKGGTRFGALEGAPVVPVTTMNLKPNDPNLLVVGMYGRGAWTYEFTRKLAVPPAPPPPSVDPPPAPQGISLAGPFGYELDAEGWTVESSGGHADLVPNQWKRGAPGSNSAISFQVTPYTDVSTTTLTSPALDHAGGWVYVDFDARRDTEPTFDFLHVEWSSDGATWNRAPWAWDAAANAWSGAKTFDGRNPGYPAFDAERVAFQAPAGALRVRFRFTSDDLVSSPLYEGLYVDNVAIAR